MWCYELGCYSRAKRSGKEIHRGSVEIEDAAIRAQETTFVICGYRQ